MPFALYFFKKIEHYIDKNTNGSSNSKELFKGLKDYGHKNGIMVDAFLEKQIP